MQVFSVKPILYYTFIYNRKCNILHIHVIPKYMYVLYTSFVNCNRFLSQTSVNLNSKRICLLNCINDILLLFFLHNQRSKQKKKVLHHTTSCICVAFPGVKQNCKLIITFVRYYPDLNQTLLKTFNYITHKLVQCYRPLNCNYMYCMIYIIRIQNV